MDKRESLIQDLTNKEDLVFPYDIQVGGYVAFNFIRRTCRVEYLKKQGCAMMEMTTSEINYIKVLFSILQSLCHLLKLILLKPKCSNVFFAFPRVDLVGDNYCDKFSDPYIDCSAIGEDYIIFENGRGGIHHHNRIHGHKIINMDMITVLSRVLSLCGYKYYYRKYRIEFDELIKRIQSIYGNEIISDKKIISIVYAGILVGNFTRFLLKVIAAKRVFAPARYIIAYMVAKQLGIRSYEIQHGITYGATDLYSGYVEESATPDYFLAFGDNEPKDVYGIAQDRIINVGWPFFDFIKKYKVIELYKNNDVLVISEPEVTDKIISATMSLAEQYPDSTFYLRLHPLEIINEHQMGMINSCSNIKIQDNRLNILIVLHAFENIIGESSTVLYEALTINKKVGKLYLSELNPLYLDANDNDSFWEIRDVGDLKTMLDAEVDDKPHRCIYSPFNQEVFNRLLGI